VATVHTGDATLEDGGMPRRRDGVRTNFNRQQAARGSRQRTRITETQPGIAEHGAHNCSWRAVDDGGVDDGLSQLTWTSWTCKEMAL